MRICPNENMKKKLRKGEKGIQRKKEGKDRGRKERKQMGVWGCQTGVKMGGSGEV